MAGVCLDRGRAAWLARLAWLFAAAMGVEARSQHPPFGHAQAIDDHLHRALAEWEVPGAALAIVQDDEVVHLRGYGVRELGRSPPMDADTVFTIASVTKSFTAAALGLLVAEGRLSWDTPVVDVLPDFRLADTALTGYVDVVDLLAHRTGAEDTMHAGLSGLTREELIGRARHFAPPRQFRKQLSYSNTMYTAAGQIIPRVAGLSWDDFLVRRLFEPLGMRASSTTAAALHAAPNRASSHVHRADGKVIVDPFVPNGWWSNDNRGPAASVNSTARDMTRWMRVLLGRGELEGRQILPATIVQDLMTPRILYDSDLPDSWLAAYGLGLVIQNHRGLRLVSHSGLYRGHGSMMMLVPEKKLGVFLFLNERDGAAGLDVGAALWIIDRILGLPPVDWSRAALAKVREARAERNAAMDKLERTRLPDTRMTLGSGEYAGVYANSAWGRWIVEMRGADLFLRSLDVSAPLEARLEHWHYDVFRPVWSEVVEDYRVAELISFRLDHLGTVESLRFENVADPYWGKVEFVREATTPPARVP